MIVVLCPLRFDNLPPNPIVAVNSKSPFDSSCFIILSSLESIDCSIVLTTLIA